MWRIFTPPSRHNTHLSHRAEAVTVVFQVGASPSALGHRHQHFEDFVVLIEIKFEDFAVFRIKNFEEKKKIFSTTFPTSITFS